MKPKDRKSFIKKVIGGYWSYELIKIVTKYKFCLFVLFIDASIVQGQNEAASKGILFKNDLSWIDAQKKAKAENKYIFVDVSASWCAPCKVMEKEVFVDDSLGIIADWKFISLRAQIDTNRNDNEFTKKWYQDSKAINEEYKPKSLPTYLFFSPDGKLVHKRAGTIGRNHFKSLLADAINPDRQYYTLYGRFNKGERDTTFLKTFLMVSSDIGEKNISELIAQELFKRLKPHEWYKKENLILLSSFINSSNDIRFKAFLVNGKMIDSLLNNPGLSERVVESVIWREMYVPCFILAKQNGAPDWVKLRSNTAIKFNKIYADRLICRAIVHWYKFKEDWAQFSKHLVLLIDKYEGPNSNPDMLNSSAWDIFTKSDNQFELNKAIIWIKYALNQMPNDFSFLDTYANLLYKTGNIKEAIEVEERVVSLFPASDEYRETLNKMQNKIPTWK